MTPEQRLGFAEQELAHLRAEYDAYAAAIAHDLAGPLRTMSAFSEIILSNNMEVFDEDTKTHFTFILSGAAQGKQMLADLRQYSLIEIPESGFTAVDTLALITRVAEELSTLRDDGSLALSIEPLPMVTAVREQLSVVFFHLLQNAWLYRDASKTPKISVSVHERDECFEFIIKDNGIGVPKNMDDTIFHLFKRGVSKTQYPGRGMGLAIVKKIIRLHGGEIMLRRDSSNETAFHFTISKNPVSL